MRKETEIPKTSKTAFFNALHRAIASKLYQNEILGQDYLAEYFLPGYYRFFLKFKFIQNNTKQKLDTAFPGLNAYVTARTAFFDQLFLSALKEKVPQIVILGAGYDSRSYRFTKFSGNTRIFELDLPMAQNRKKKCLKNAGIEVPENVTYVPADLNKTTLNQALESVGYQSNKRTLITWEGVSYYLDPESVEKTLTFFSSIPQKHSLLAFDYMISLDEENIGDYFGAESFIQSMQNAHADEAILFSLKEGEINDYLEQKGLHLLEHLDSKEIEKRFLTDDQGNLISRITGHFRFALTNPIK